MSSSFLMVLSGKGQLACKYTAEGQSCSAGRHSPAGLSAHLTGMAVKGSAVVFLSSLSGSFFLFVSLYLFELPSVPLSRPLLASVYLLIQICRLLLIPSVCMWPEWASWARCSALSAWAPKSPFLAWSETIPSAVRISPYPPASLRSILPQLWASLTLFSVCFPWFLWGWGRN